MKNFKAKDLMVTVHASESKSFVNSDAGHFDLCLNDLQQCASPSKGNNGCSSPSRTNCPSPSRPQCVSPSRVQEPSQERNLACDSPSRSVEPEIQNQSYLRQLTELKMTIAMLEQAAKKAEPVEVSA